MVGVNWKAFEKELEAEMQTDPLTTKSSNPKDVLAANEQRVLLHLVPSPALAHVAHALMDGARKYGPYNWRKEGVSAVTYVSAAMRHIRDWLDGEEVAPDSGVHHLGHAAACLAILLDSIEVENLVDDRPAPAPTAEIHERMKWSGEPQNPESFDPASDFGATYEEKLRAAHAAAPGNVLFRDLLRRLDEEPAEAPLD